MAEFTSKIRIKVSGQPHHISELEQAILQLEAGRRIPFSLNLSSANLSREALLQMASDLSEPFDGDEEIELDFSFIAELEQATIDDDETITVTGRIIPTYLIDIEED